MTHWLITGASGLLGSALCASIAARGDKVIAITHSHALDIAGAEEINVDLMESSQARDLVERYRPDVTVHAAGLTDVDACERNEAVARRLHADVASDFASACKAHDRKFVYVSTDHLWRGNTPMAREGDAVQPINAYARTKAEGEARVLAANPAALIMRTNFFGSGRPWRKSISDWMIDALRGGKPIQGFADSFFTPIHLDHLVYMTSLLVEKDVAGIYHVAGRDRLSKYEFALKICRKLGLPEGRVIKAKMSDARLAAPRPADLSLNTEKVSALLGHPMPGIDDGLARIVLGDAPSGIEKEPDRAHVMR